jgi:hypothetical protein
MRFEVDHDGTSFGCDVASGAHAPTKTKLDREQPSRLAHRNAKVGVMGLKMASLLIHSEELPAAARDALEAARDGSAEERPRWLESAAQILHDEMGLACSDALELVDLHPGEDAE